MADTAVLTGLIAGGTGVLTAAAGYATARNHSAVELRRISREERESQEARQARALEARRALYLEYMAAYDQFSDLPNKFDLTSAELSKRIAAVREVTNRIKLLGSPAVCDRVTEIRQLHAAAIGEIDHAAENLNAEIRTKVFFPLQGPRDQAYDRLLAAMRDDVADS